MLTFESRFLANDFAAANQISSKMEMRGLVKSCSGSTVDVSGFDYPVCTGVKLKALSGENIRGEVTGFADGETIVQTFQSNPPIHRNAVVHLAASASQASVGSALLGRVIGALGEPLDSAEKIATADFWPMAGRLQNVLNKGRVTRQIDTGVRAINALVPTGRGQRLALIAGSGVGKSMLIKQLVLGIEADVVVIGLIGERAREVSDFVATVREEGQMARTIIVAVPADHSAIMRIKGVQRATSIAEYFRDKGQSVLLIVDSLTRVAHGQREIGLAMGEPPTMKGYPPSAIALIPALIERAGNDQRSGGAITAIYTILADGDDLDDPVVDAARAITDGHIILSRRLAESGIFPAIDVGKSLSRVADDITGDEHKDAMLRYRALWSCYEDNHDLISIGAYREGSNISIDQAIARRGEQLAFISQDHSQYINAEKSSEMLIAEFGA